MRHVAQLGDVGGLDRLGEARPAAAGFIFVAAREQGLAGNDVDVDARLLVVEERARAGAFGAGLLGDVILLGGQRRDGVVGLAIVGPREIPAFAGMTEGGSYRASKLRSS